MKKFVTAAFLAASLFAGSAASAAVVVFNSGSPAPASNNFVTASDISVGSIVNATEILFAGDTAEFTFTALEDLQVLPISLSATGSKSSLELVLSGLSFPASNNFSTISGPASASSAVAFLSGFKLLSGESFTIFWSANGAQSAGVTAFFSTTAVPVPAALPLLMGGVAALGLVRRKKSKAAAA